MVKVSGFVALITTVKLADEAEPGEAVDFTVHADVGPTMEIGMFPINLMSPRMTGGATHDVAGARASLAELGTEILADVCALGAMINGDDSEFDGLAIDDTNSMEASVSTVRIATTTVMLPAVATLGPFFIAQITLVK
jgi:hypothetical protein